MAVSPGWSGSEQFNIVLQDITVKVPGSYTSASLFSTLSVDLVGRECPAGGLKGKSKPDARLTVGGSELDYMFGVDRFS